MAPEAPIDRARAMPLPLPIPPEATTGTVCASEMICGNISHTLRVGLHMPSGLDALADQEVSANIQRALRTVNRCDLKAVACAVRSHESDLFSSGYSPRECNNANTGLK